MVPFLQLATNYQHEKPIMAELWNTAAEKASELQQNVRTRATNLVLNQTWTPSKALLLSNGIFTTLLSVRLLAIGLLYVFQYRHDVFHQHSLQYISLTLAVPTVCVILGSGLVYQNRSLIIGAWMSAIGYLLYAVLDVRNSPFGVNVIVGTLGMAICLWSLCQRTEPFSGNTWSTMIQTLRGVTIGSILLSLLVTAWSVFVTIVNLLDTRHANDEGGEDSWVEFQEQVRTDYQGFLRGQLIMEGLTIVASIVGLVSVAAMDRSSHDYRPLYGAIVGGVVAFCLKLFSGVETGYVIVDTSVFLLLQMPLVLFIGSWLVPFHQDGFPFVTSPNKTVAAEDEETASKLNYQFSSDTERLSKESTFINTPWSQPVLLHALYVLNVMWLHLVLLNLFQTFAVVDLVEQVVHYSHFIGCVLLIATAVHGQGTPIATLACGVCFALYTMVAIYYADLDFGMLSVVLALPHAVHAWTEYQHYKLKEATLSFDYTMSSEQSVQK